MGRKFTILLNCFTLYSRANSKYKLPGGLILFWRVDLTEGFLRYDFGGLIFGGAYTWRGIFSEFYGIVHQNTLIINFSEVQLTFYSKEKKTIL